MEKLVIDDRFHTVQYEIEAGIAHLCRYELTFEREGSNLIIRATHEDDILHVIHLLVVSGRTFAYTFGEQR